MAHPRRSLRSLIPQLRDGAVTAKQLLREAHDRASQLEPKLNAYKTWLSAYSERAAEAADAAFRAGAAVAPLQGIPISVKDIFGLDNAPIFAGTKRELPTTWNKEGPVVTEVRRQLAVFTGKTQTVEFAFGALGVNSHWGTPRNPWDSVDHRVPGGSSSGAAVSLCQGSALVAIGSDTAGSVRIPASLTANVGFKPTQRRWPTAGIVPLSPLLDSPGILARSVDDVHIAAAAIDSRVTSAYAPLDSDMQGREGLRLGVPEEFFWEDCTPSIAAEVNACLKELERAGHKLVPIRVPEASDAHQIISEGGTSGAELLAFIRSDLPEWLKDLDPLIEQRLTASAHMSGIELADRMMRMRRLAARAGRSFADVDAIVSPTVPIPPPKLSDVTSWDSYRTHNFRMIRYTCVANILDLPALSMPVALDSSGLPIGLQVMARVGTDQELLQIGGAIERILGTGRERLGYPPLAVD
ncbi:MAG: amidase [Pseudomonadota bacterium]